MSDALVIKFQGPALDEVAKALREQLGTGQFAANVFNKHMLAAVKDAMKPGVKILKDKTPKGPTGNLKKSVQQVTRNYKKDRRFFGAVGYSASGGKTKIAKAGYNTGSSLGYHQGLVEFGTKPRKTFGRFASSISRFTSTKVSNKKSGGLVTTPKPPKGFFKSAPAGQQVDMGQMKGQKNIPAVYGMASDFMESSLKANSADRVEKAWKELQYHANKLKQYS